MYDIAEMSRAYLIAHEQAAKLIKREDTQQDVDRIAKEFGLPRDLVERRLEAKFRQKILNNDPNVPMTWKAPL